MRIVSVTANRHFFEGRPNGRPFRFLLTFDAGKRVRLAGAGDGFRMLVDDRPLEEPIDMGECGSVVLEDVSGLFPHLIEAQSVTLVSLELNGAQIGVQLVLDEGGAFCFWIDGDETWWGDATALAAHDWLDGNVPVVRAPLLL